MTAYLSPVFDTQFFDGSTVAAGYKLYTYESGTTTPKAVYSDQAGTVPHTNPIVLDANGRVTGQMWLGSGEYTFTLKTSADVMVKTWNDVAGSSTIIDSAAYDAAIRADLASASDSSKGAGMVGFNPSKNYAAGTIGYALNQAEICANWFTGVDPTGASDSTTALQTVINFAQAMVSDAVDATGDSVGGATIRLQGKYKITDPLRISQSNINIEGGGGATIYPYFTSSTGYNGAKPAFIIGTAESWQTGGSIGTAYKYNRVRGLLIKRVSGYNSFIGFLLSGTRNADISHCLVERAYCGLFLENSSEFTSTNFSSIGCTYSIVGDNRGNRTAANSVLNVACTDNDVSSCTFTHPTSYYPQHTGVLLINTGTVTISGGTIGQFCAAPGATSLGFPATYAGIHVYGADSKWTRSGSFSGIVFEARTTFSTDCVRIESTTANNPVLGVIVSGAHVQTFANDHAGGNVTTLLHAVQSGSGDVASIVLRDSGFTYQSAGYLYGNLCNVEGNAIVAHDGCYPNTAFATSSLGYYGSVRHTNVLERVALDAFPPTGWTAVGTTTGCTKNGGASGVVSSLMFTGDAGQISISKRFTMREYVPEIGAVFVSFLVRGTGALYCASRTNGDSSSFTDNVTGTNQGRYGNAIIYPTLNSSTAWKRIFFCFNPNSVGYPFDNVDFYLGKKAGSSSAEWVEIQDIRVGYVIGGVVAYNPF